MRKPLEIHVALFMQNMVQFRAPEPVFCEQITNMKCKNLKKYANFSIRRPSVVVHSGGPQIWSEKSTRVPLRASDEVLAIENIVLRAPSTRRLTRSAVDI